MPPAALRRTSRRGAWRLISGLLLAAGGCAAEAPAKPRFEQPADRGVADLEVRRRGRVLLDVAARRRLLRRMPDDRRALLCGDGRGWPEIEPLAGLTIQEDGGPDDSGQPFAQLMMQATAAYLAGADPGAAREAVVGTLEGWAGADALLDVEKASNVYYALDRLLLPTIVAWSMLRPDDRVSKRQRRRIDAWIADLVELRGPKRPAQSATDASTRNNHAYLAASVDMAWGALAGDDRAYRQGPAAYRMAIRDMRLDGSLPLETDRDARALWYQRHALASLTVIAEMAAVQGHDLYDYALDGRDLHQAIRFLLDAIDDPGIVAPYTRAHHEQDLGFLRRRGRVRHYMAWVELYAARFPERSESRQLLRLVAAREPDFRPMLDDYSGGATSCFVAS